MSRKMKGVREGALLASTPEPLCTLTELHRCLQSLQTQSNDLAFAATRYELLNVCSTMKESVLCIDDHMKHCFSPTQRQVFNQVVAGARQVLLELCVPGAIQEAYLKYAPCFKNVSQAENKCAPKYRYLMELSESVNRRQNVDDGLRESCCAFGEFVTCKYQHVGRDCGHDATLFLQQHLDRISSPLIHEHCAHYTYATDACAPASTSKALNMSWKLLSYLLFTQWISLRFILKKTLDYRLEPK
ncbi:uncharacterized protein LOC118189057 isoform X2 [Stegodyphus dumicola]|uniref:uncharacterized protein LOC118189057 isoform X2 n=1 Tax=Stegodyphus dumicola TaxID=202533 RepID=UPI0015B002C9|nr:uncharacterized protein LOC118189057 isoform X2 [Stegodyphus dumicola]